MPAHLPTNYAARFFGLKSEAEEGPYSMSLRALFRGRPIPKSNLSEFELALYVDCTLVWRKTAVALPADKMAKRDDLMGQSLREICLYGST